MENNITDDVALGMFMYLDTIIILYPSPPNNPIGVTEFKANPVIVSFNKLQNPMDIFSLPLIMILHEMVFII